jgi:hypothetical protein
MNCLKAIPLPASCDAGKKLITNAILRHIGRAKNCKAYYGTRFEDMKKKKRTEKDNKYRQNNADIRKEKQTIYNKSNKEVNKEKHANYNFTNKEVIKEKQANYNLTHKEVIKETQAKYNLKHKEVNQEKHANYNFTNKEVIKEKQANYNLTHKEVIKEKQAMYNAQHHTAIAEKINQKRRKMKTERTDKDRLLYFKEDVKDGPSFVCCCCQKLLFKQSVQVLKDQDISKMMEKHKSLKEGRDFLKKSITAYDGQANYLCHNCLRLLRNKRMPAQSIGNKLELADIPPQLELTELENQMVAMSIPFMKIKCLPRSRMLANIDRIINVPLQDEDVAKTVNNLPRLPSNAAVCAVRFKRMKAMKNVYKEAFVRPRMLIDAVKIFKELGHKAYANIKINDHYEEQLEAELETIFEDDNEDEEEKDQPRQTKSKSRKKPIPQDVQGTKIDALLDIEMDCEHEQPKRSQGTQLDALYTQFEENSVASPGAKVDAIMEEYDYPAIPDYLQNSQGSKVDALFEEADYYMQDEQDEPRQCRLEEDDKSIMDQAKLDSILDDQHLTTEKDSEDEDEEEVDPVRKYQVQGGLATCMVPEDPSAMVVVNTTAATLMKKTKRKSNDVYEIAPGEGKIPTNWLRDKDFDVNAYPILHPNGKNGLHEERVEKLSIQKYMIQRVMNKDPRFRQQPSYLFMAQQAVERDAIEKQINIAAQRGKPGGSGETMQVMDPYSIFARMKGTPKYFQTLRNENFARIKQFGGFQVFFTLSCGEMRWSEMFLSIFKRDGLQVEYVLDENGQWSGDDIDVLVNGKPIWEFVESTGKSKHQLLKDEIFHMTRMFDHRVRTFMKHILLGEGEGSIPYSYYCYRVEFQARGMPHIHGILWIDNQYMEKYLVPGKKLEYADNVTELIDNITSCKIPDEDPKLAEKVTEVQWHRHSKSCKKWSNSCRFNFPRFPSPVTLIANPPSSDLSDEEKKKLVDDSTAILEKARTFLEKDDIDEDMTFSQFLKAIDVEQTAYMDALKITARGSVVILKRRVKERFINNYNPEFLSAWNANMDIQFCHNVYAVCTYISDYVGKDESGITEILRQTLKKNKGASQETLLKTLKHAYLTHRQIGMSEAVYRLLPFLHMKDSNTKCIFVPSGFPENRSVFFRHATEDEEDCEEEDVNGNLVEIEGRAGKFLQTLTVHERFSERSDMLEDMCLAQFATLYQPIKTIPKKVVMTNGVSDVLGNNTLFSDSNMILPKYLELKNKKMGSMSQRGNPCVLRLHSSKKKEGHEQFYADMCLFLPWRNEEQEFFRDDPLQCIAVYKDSIQKLSDNQRQMFPFSEEIDAIQESIENGTFDARPAHIYDLLDAQAEQADDDDNVVGMQDDPAYAGIDPDNLTKEQRGSDQVHNETFKFRQIHVEDDCELLEMTRRLVPEQMVVLEKVVGFCKCVVKSRNPNVEYPDPLNLIIHGGAGNTNLKHK